MSFRLVVLLTTALVLAGCGTFSDFLARSGPFLRAREDGAGTNGVTSLDSTRLRELVRDARPASFASLPPPRPFDHRITVGDRVEVMLIEAAPAFLLGSTSLADASGLARTLMVPPQLIGPEGTLSVPFVGDLRVAGRTVGQVRAEIERALLDKANRPQAVVRIVDGGGQQVAVVGDVREPKRLPLEIRPTRILDAIALARGTASPVDKVVVSVTRQGVTVQKPLQDVLRSPQENIVLSAGDIVTVYHKPQYFVALGAVTQQGEFPFEATGITLAQAVARAGGLVDSRAAPSGVFLARPDPFEPKLWKVDLTVPEGFFVMSHMPVRDGDIIYVANAESAELQKFLNLIGTVFGIGVNAALLAR